MSIPWYRALGYELDVAILSQLPAALILILSVYAIGKEIHTREAGLLAAALSVLLPGVVGFSRSYLQEFTLMAAVALSLALMLKSNGFSHRGYTLAFGVSVGIGLLAKWSYTAFVIGPFMLYAWHSHRGVSSLRDGLLKGCWLLLSVGIGLYLASLWYLPNMEYILGFTEVRLHLGVGGGTMLLLLKKAMFYPSALFTHQLLPFFGAVSLVSLAYLALIKQKSLLLLMLWIVLPGLIIMSVVRDPQSPRYTIPYVPAFALLSAIAIMSCPPRLRTGIMTFVVLGGTLQFFLLSYQMLPIPLSGRVQWGMLALDADDWGVESLGGALRAHLAVNARIISLNEGLYDKFFFRSESYQGRLPPFNVTNWYFCYAGRTVCGYDYEYYEQHLIEADAVIIGRYRGPNPMPTPQEYEWAMQAWSLASRLFRRVSVLVLPDGTQVEVYVKRTLNFIGPEKRSTDTPDIRLFDFHMGPGGDPALLTIHYLAPHLKEEVSVMVQGIPFANLSSTPPVPGRTVSILLPPGLSENGTMRVSIGGGASMNIQSVNLGLIDTT